MAYPDRRQYEKLADSHDLIPVFREFLADTETPVSVLRRFASHANVFLLESMEGGETWGRYSYLGVDPEVCLEVDHALPPSGQLRQLRSAYAGCRPAPVPGAPRFFGGMVGFLGYEAAGEFEKLPQPLQAPPNVLLRSRFVRADRLIVFDNVRHTVKIVVCSRPADHANRALAYDDALSQIDAIASVMASPAPAAPAAVYQAPVFQSNMEPERFKHMVSRAKEYIHAGDIIQAVLSQRFTAPCRVPAVEIYRALRLLNPSPYTFFFKTGDHVLVGSSPEVMVRLTGSRVELRPIAGTRPRGATEQEDRRLADELLSDVKEKAEHVMLVDLGRNDVGRIAETGSVQVTEYMVVERYSHVMHLVSHVQGILRRDLDAYDVIKATFPAGTLSGAPKIRAMEIIHELESQPRGVYGGAVGYIGCDGSMDLAITIRTIEVCPDSVAVQAGAGVVYDSDPDREFEETCHKAAAMRKAVEMAAGGLKIDSAEEPAGSQNRPTEPSRTAGVVCRPTL